MIATISILWYNKGRFICIGISKTDNVMEKIRNVMQRFTYFVIL